VKILLINASPVVSRLFALCIRDRDIELDEVEKSGDIEYGKAYDLLVVDDASYNPSIQNFITKSSLNYKLFISYEEGKVAGFDKTVKKPFLPSRILEIIEHVPVKEVVQEEEPILFASPPEEKSRSNQPHVLDSEEIEKIKSLLDMDEKPTKRKKSVWRFSDEELRVIEGVLKEALFSLEPKKIKKLLKGKEIELKLKIKDQF